VNEIGQLDQHKFGLSPPDGNGIDTGDSEASPVLCFRYAVWADVLTPSVQAERVFLDSRDTAYASLATYDCVYSYLARC